MSTEGYLIKKNIHIKKDKYDLGGISTGMVLLTFKINEKGTNRTNTTEKAERNEIDFTKTSLFYLRFGGLAVT